MQDISCGQVQVFSTCPMYSSSPGNYLESVRRVARWCDRAGFTGILVPVSGADVDPWVVSQEILCSTDKLSPLVAVQPFYIHPYTAAKLITSYGCLYGRRIYLNMVAGASRSDLEALGDRTPHDERYDRLVEYSFCLQQLLAGRGPVTFHGRYYEVNGLRLAPALPAELAPGFLVSGSSDAGAAAAKTIGATPISHPEPAAAYAGRRELGGVRIGMIARDSTEAAWRVALERFPGSRTGRMTHAMARRRTDSAWYQRLSSIEEHPAGVDNPYWLGPFKNVQAFGPFLVGSYQTVSAEVRHYMRRGCTTFILDIPRDEDDLGHASIVLELASKSALPDA